LGKKEGGVTLCKRGGKKLAGLGVCGIAVHWREEKGEGALKRIADHAVILKGGRRCPASKEKGSGSLWPTFQIANMSLKGRVGK